MVNPGAIIGPVLSDDRSYSLEAVERLLDGHARRAASSASASSTSATSPTSSCRAMTSPEAGGERFIAVTECLWFEDVARILRERLGDRASKVPTRTIPNFVVRTMALFDGGLQSVVGDLGKRTDALLREGPHHPRLAAARRSRTRSRRRPRA